MTSHALLTLSVKGLKRNIFRDSYVLIPNIPKVGCSLGNMYFLFISSQWIESSAWRIAYDFSLVRGWVGCSLTHAQQMQRVTMKFLTGDAVQSSVIQ